MLDPFNWRALIFDHIDWLAPILDLAQWLALTARPIWLTWGGYSPARLIGLR